MIVKNYIEQATIAPNDSSYKQQLPHEFTATKQDCKNDPNILAQLEREFNINLQLVMGELIYLLTTRVKVIFSV